MRFDAQSELTALLVGGCRRGRSECVHGRGRCTRWIDCSIVAVDLVLCCPQQFVWHSIDFSVLAVDPVPRHPQRAVGLSIPCDACRIG